MTGDKSINILCSYCKLDVTIPGGVKSCPRCGCGLFNTSNNLGTDKGQPNKTSPTYKGSVNRSMDSRNSGFKLNGANRFN